MCSPNKPVVGGRPHRPHNERRHIIVTEGETGIGVVQTDRHQSNFMACLSTGLHRCQPEDNGLKFSQANERPVETCP